MQQRQLRLGDILDDYCPRERRLTNHAVVAMVGDEVKQTRCTTCDAEHEYKRARLPVLRRKKDSVSTAYSEVLASVTTDATMQSAQAAASGNGDEAPPEAASLPSTDKPADAVEAQAEPERVEAVAAGEPDNGEAAEAGENGEGSDDAAGRVHRRLIRATLPRPENQQAQRPVPEFTMRQPQGRPGKFRSARGPAAARAATSPRGGGYANNNSRAGGFGRAAGGRTSGARNDFHRPPRGGHAPRRDKKHSK
jgi:hypothetical protein